MFSIEKYIFLQYPDATFDEVKYVQSTAGLINIDYGQEAVKAILYHEIYWSPTGGGATFNFTDQFNFVLFSAINVTGSSANWAPLPLIRKGSTVKISCSVNMLFTVSFQKIR